MDTGAGSGIVTPEGVRLAFENAGIGSRSVALMIDIAARVVALYVLFTVVGLLTLGGGGEVAAVVLGLTGSFLVIVGYPVVFEVFNGGRTLGKMALGLRVVTVEGAPVRFRHAAIRSALELVDLFLSFGVVAMVTATLNRRSQRLGDIVAGTMVVRTRSASSGVTAFTFVPPSGWESFAERLDITRMDHDMHVLVRTFLVRIHALAPEHRQRLSQELAGRCAERLGVALAPTTAAVDFLIAVTAAYQRSRTQAIVPDGRRHGTGPPPPVLAPPSLSPTWGTMAAPG